MEAPDFEAPCRGDECRGQRAARQEQEARQAIIEAQVSLQTATDKLARALEIMATFGEVPFEELERDR